MKFIVFLLPVLLFSQTEVICVDGFKYIKFTQNDKTVQVIPKIIYYPRLKFKLQLVGE